MTNKTSLICATLVFLLTLPAYAQSTAAFSVNREAIPAVTVYSIYGNTEVKTDAVGLFAFPFVTDELDAFYQISVSNDGPQIEVEILSRTYNGFSVAFRVNGELYDPPNLCVVTSYR